jgi:hypothetical protein
MDALVHILYEVAGTAGAVTSKSGASSLTKYHHLTKGGYSFRHDRHFWL